ncbi:MAG TPA: lactate utilization protein [Candidatus Paceibacterota bacterium]|nr:lactate utilization protein [Candidatus Paceibacterota bacterium]
MNTLANAESIKKTEEALKANGFEPIHVKSKEAALEKVKELIPAGASVMNGASKTLQEIGLIEYLKSGEHPWNNLQDPILAEPDQARQAQMRREAVVSDFYLGSVHALTETGELTVASNTGSQLPHLVFTSPNLVLVVGANKIVPTLKDAFVRLDKQVLPLENERIQGLYGIDTTWAKTVILHKENTMLGRKVYVVIVDEQLGF